MELREELIAMGCRILDEGAGKIIVSCPKPQLESGLVVKKKPIDIERRRNDAILTFRKE